MDIREWYEDMTMPIMVIFILLITVVPLTVMFIERSMRFYDDTINEAAFQLSRPQQCKDCEPRWLPHWKLKMWYRRVFYSGLLVGLFLFLPDIIEDGRLKDVLMFILGTLILMLVLGNLIQEGYTYTVGFIGMMKVFNVFPLILIEILFIYALVIRIGNTYPNTDGGVITLGVLGIYTTVTFIVFLLVYKTMNKIQR